MTRTNREVYQLETPSMSAGTLRPRVWGHIDRLSRAFGLLEPLMSEPY